MFVTVLYEEDLVRLLLSGNVTASHVERISAAVGTALDERRRVEVDVTGTSRPVRALQHVGTAIRGLEPTAVERVRLVAR